MKHIIIWSAPKFSSFFITIYIELLEFWIIFFFQFYAFCKGIWLSYFFIFSASILLILCLGFLEADTRWGLGKTGREVGKLEREDVRKSKMCAVKQVDTEGNWILMLWELWWYGRKETGAVLQEN